MWWVWAACHRDAARREPPEPTPTAPSTPAPGTTPTELPPRCGDGSCDSDDRGPPESCGVCPVDCGACAPTCDRDGICEGRLGETCPACRADCDTRAAACGNGACDEGEDSVGCMVDCGPPAWPEAWAAAEAAVVEAIDARRAQGGDCPSGSRPPAPPLADDPTLRGFARARAWDLSLSDYYADPSCNGRTLAERAPGASAESLGWAWPTPEAAVAAWARTSPACEELFDPAHTRVGVGFSDVGGDSLWVATYR